MYQIALIGLQNAVTNDGTIKQLREIAEKSPNFDAFLMTVLTIADTVYNKASRRLPEEIRNKIWAHKHAGQHEQARIVACRYLDINYHDPFD